MSGGKGGSSTTKVEVPQYIEDAARANLAKADELAKIGYTPYYGPDVAAFTPMQLASFQNTSDMAGAFGLATPSSQQDIYGGMGAPTTYANGVSGYSSAPMFEQSMAELQYRRPGQYAAINAPFIDPVTGAQPGAPYQGVAGIEAARAAEQAGMPAPTYTSGGSSSDAMRYISNSDGSNSSPYTSSNTPMSYMPGGVNSINPRGVGNQAAALATSRPQGAPTAADRPAMRPDNLDTSGSGGGPNDGCVVATHAVESGAFTPSMKREAVVWCMNVLHDKWWGEAIRRGYRHLGKKKIEQGKAREHYDEFRRYINFANGKERTLSGAATFAFRSVQFLAVGLVKKDA